MKVVDLINNSPAEARPTVLVSATAVGYYGLLQSYLRSHRSLHSLIWSCQHEF